jgi:hypothetical protein
MNQQNWEKEFNERFVAPKPFDDGLLAIKADIIKSFIQSTIDQAVEAERKMIIDQIKKMNLWSKGNAEGTRNDIIARLD